MPQQLQLATKAFYDKKAIVFVLFDVTRPATFYESTGEHIINVKYLMNEVNTQNTNKKIL